MNVEQKIAERVRKVPPSGIRKFFDIVSEMKDAISLGVGEPDFVTPSNIRAAAIYSLDRGYTHYTSNWGLLELRQEVSKYLSHRFHIDYDAKDEILITVGASEGIDLALRALLNPDDEVLVPEPSYVSYNPGVVIAGGSAVPLITRAQNGFKLTGKAVRHAITPRTKALILPYPNNPTGAIMEKEYLEDIADAIRDTEIIVISDEIYAELTYGGQHVSFASLPGMKDRTIVINGFSKAFAMTGWRIGIAAGHKALVGAMTKIHQYSMLCAPTIGQMAALEALKEGYANSYDEVIKMTRIYDRRRNILVSAFNEIGLDCFEPKGAFYVFPSIARTGLTSEVFCDKLLKEQKVAVVPGTAFGESGEGFIRCSYAASTKSIQEAIERIKIFVAPYIAK